MNLTNARVAAALILASVLNKDGSLTTHLHAHRQHQQYSLLQELCFGFCRWYFQLDAILQTLMEKPMRGKDLDVKCLLLLGLYQLKELRIPDHAAINETVKSATLLKKPWAKGLINGVLRQYLRQQIEVNAKTDQDPIAHYAHPSWMLDQIQNQWSQHWQEILTANNSRPPMTLRVNLSKTSRQDYLHKLQQAGLSSHAGSLSDSAVYLDVPQPVADLPGFTQGLCSVQDEASQLVASLLELAPGQRVLDSCAAPGGKTSHILECEESLAQLIAIDMDKSRSERIRENLDRLGLSAELVIADAADPRSWWDEVAFDRILLDVPCSATGVIRRHPDIKLLRSAADLDQIKTVQLKLLRSLWSCLKPGGLMLYTSCSILRQENEEVIALFLEHNNNAKHEAITADWGVKCRFGRQLLPAIAGQDGFYFCKLTKL